MNKAVFGGMTWTIIAIIIGIAAVALLYLFMTEAGKSITDQFGGMVDSFKGTVCGLVGPAGIFMGC